MPTTTVPADPSPAARRDVLIAYACALGEARRAIDAAMGKLVYARRGLGRHGDALGVAPEMAERVLHAASGSLTTLDEAARWLAREPVASDDTEPRLPLGEPAPNAVPGLKLVAG
jgi:hypothetical protein